MEHVSMLFQQLQNMIENYSPALLPCLPFLLVLMVFISQYGAKNQPPSLDDPIPFLFNTSQFLLDNEKFMRRVKKALKTTSLARFYQGTNLVYLVAGPKNVRTVFGRSQNINNDGIMLRLNLPIWYRLSKKDLKRFATDRSGRGRHPLPGTECIPPEKRYFFGYEHVHGEYLVKPQYLNPLLEIYQQQISQALDTYPADSWTVISMRKFCKQEVTKCALHTLIGPKIFELSPNILDLLWDFDDVIIPLVIGLPRWIYPRPHKVHDRYLAAMHKYLDSAWAQFNWSDVASTSAPWEPHFGAQVSREVVKWFGDSGFNSPDTGAGAIGILTWAQNSNVIPIMMWMLMEISKDSSLIQALREEFDTAYTIDSSTGTRSLSIQKVTSLPLLSSVYSETLRMNMSFNVVRDVGETFTLDGYTVKKGAMIQVPTLVAHYDDGVWGEEKHPASEFWAERHIKYTEEKGENGHVSYKRIFSMEGRSGSYFPYGGGNLICPGRHFAKYEIMLTAGLLVSHFDIELVEWTNLDGTTSDRPAKHDGSVCGSGSAPPDRDMKIRIKKISPL